jgi:hypothetical protein
MILKQSKMLNSADKSVTAFVEFWSETKFPKSIFLGFASKVTIRAFSV